MKKITFLFLLFFLFCSYEKSYSQKIYKYDTIAGDPLKARIYTLDNGMKIYLSVYKNEPRIQTIIAVKAGSKNDPHETTGLAHYFEHMMFKGTAHFGTLDWKTEEPLINRIDSLFEVYRFVKDSSERIRLYHIIDSISFIASGYAIPNEYFKLASILGAKGTNAATSLERTYYVNDIPSNRLNQWLEIESERFSNPVLRLFHTELETIYEEKNMNLTNDSRKVFTSLLEGLFQKHTYGTQTTLGESEHLKNPSLKNIRNFYNEYYVPNNMAICISGDLNPDETIRLIDKYFNSFKSKKVPPFNFEKEEPIKKPVIKDVYGPDAENITLAFRFDGANSKDVDMITLVDMILSNSSAGLIDLNLLKKQKVLEAYSYPFFLKDYSTLMLYGKPKNGQTLDEVKNLLLEQIELIKKGDFPDNLLPAIINNLKLDQIKNYESNNSRASAMVDAFIMDIPWTNVVNNFDRLSKITKKDIVNFVNQKFNNNNYVQVNKHTGKDTTIVTIKKPPITPIKMNRDQKSDFLVNIEKENIPEIKPVFIDYQKDIAHLQMANGISLNYKKNNENATFDLYYIFDLGTNHNKKIDMALDYLNFIGTSKYTAEQIEKEFFQLACSFSVSATNDQVYVRLSGLSENFEPALKLVEHLLNDAQPDTLALKNLIDDKIKKRLDAKKNPRTIFSALVAYGIYGAVSPFTYKLSEEELKKLTAEELIAEIKNLFTIEHRILFYGSNSSDELLANLNKYHITPKALKSAPAEHSFAESPLNEKKIYIVDFDMKQANIVFLSKGIQGYNKDLAPVSNLYNKYFGSGPGAIVWQEIREARSLAYTANSTYQAPSRKNKSYYNVSFLGTQHDKINLALDAFTNILNQMPESEKSFKTAINSIMQSLPSERITKASILFNYESAKKLGLDYDIRKDIFEKTPTLTFQDIKNFQNEYILNKPLTILILADKKQLDIDTLKKYGTIEFLKMEDVFGY